jgi:hypothetical protein
MKQLAATGKNDVPDELYIAYEHAMMRLKDPEEAPKLPKLCSCEIVSLMQAGCLCGGE